MNEANSDSSSSVDLRHTYLLCEEHWIYQTVRFLFLCMFKLPNNSTANTSSELQTVRLAVHCTEYMNECKYLPYNDCKVCEFC